MLGSRDRSLQNLSTRGAHARITHACNEHQFRLMTNFLSGTHMRPPPTLLESGQVCANALHAARVLCLFISILPVTTRLLIGEIWAIICKPFSLPSSNAILGVWQCCPYFPVHFMVLCSSVPVLVMMPHKILVRYTRNKRPSACASVACANENVLMLRRT